MRNAVLYFFIASVLLHTRAIAQAQPKKINQVVLDAGHGGHDAGARGGSGLLNEKDIALAVTLKVGRLINDSLKMVKPIFTRTTDVFIPLADRHKIANQAGADLFVAIHVNASPGSYEKIRTGSRTIGKGRKKKTVPVYKTIHHRETAAYGTETWVLGLNRTGQKEGAISEYGDKITEEPGILNENDPETAIIIAQYAQVFLKKSVDFAQKVQDQFAAQGRRDLGIKQRGLEVLAGSVMPGALIEIGFINNVEEELYLNSEKGQNEVAYAIFKAIRNYKREVEKIN
ncbi:MAG: N-acetylmuramoyl-L-alanine amidase [Chitinophagaceae bacterium]|nr:N-acetylmuramoyl-L-alanine amidase [Chitinophagaceae bacterium]